MLQSETEKERLLREIPKVIAEQVKFDSVMKGYLDDKIDDDSLSSPEQTPQENQVITRAAMNNPAEINSPSDDEFYDYLSSPEGSNLETVRPEPNGSAWNSGTKSAGNYSFSNSSAHCIYISWLKENSTENLKNVGFVKCGLGVSSLLKVDSDSKLHIDLKL